MAAVEGSLTKLTPKQVSSNSQNHTNFTGFISYRADERYTATHTMFAVVIIPL